VDKSTSFTVSENDSLAVTVTFRPAAVKSYSGNITINSDDPDEPQVFVSVSGTGVAPEIEVLPASLSFDIVFVSESSQKTFTILNTGTAVLNINKFYIHYAFSLDKHPPFTIPENDSLVVTVTFRPQAVKSYSGNITIFSDDPDEPQVTVSVSGTGAPAPEIEILHTSLSFGFVTVSVSSQKTFTILNTGTAVLNVTSITAPDGFTVFPSTGFTVPENGNRIVTVTFAPTAVKSYSGNIIINSDDPNEPKVIVSVSGIGIPVLYPEIEVVPDWLYFGYVVQYLFTTTTLTIKNTGTGDLTITNIIEPDDFFMVDLVIPFTIPANCSKEVTVGFQPYELGLYEDNLIIESNDSDEPQVSVKVIGYSEPMYPE